MRSSSNTYILGGGVTGLAAGLGSGFPVFEARPTAGGICGSYYIRRADSKLLYAMPEDEEAYRFEIGGGHWIFGASPEILNFIRQRTPVKKYSRKSSVYLPEQRLFVPYPVQNHLRCFAPATRERIVSEIQKTPLKEAVTMKEGLENNFGKTLFNLFFGPYHRLFTADLYAEIAPQDSYKSPFDREAILRGASGDVNPAGYNTSYLYPEKGLSALTAKMAADCDIYFEKKITRIDVHKREISFQDGQTLPYEKLISTLPLNKAMELAALSVDEKPAPYTSVLVLNLGAEKGPRCPEDHWVYFPSSGAGFHRVGFYSNVDASFLPRSLRGSPTHASLYVERAFKGGDSIISEEARDRYRQDVLEELQAYGYIGDVEVADFNWIEVAYTWSYPGSAWKQKALALLEKHGIFQVGRYGRWIFQGIADSISDGLAIAEKLG